VRYRRLSQVPHMVSGESAPGFLIHLPLKATAYCTQFTHRKPWPMRPSYIKASVAAQMWTAFFKKTRFFSPALATCHSRCPFRTISSTLLPTHAPHQ